ncbi:hypothetical protein HPB47_006683 [Ixodes persulcatus]|uniref:Uncharacterized protein n=1 Tax=Ixodes persulcatus TaxID=34615 RepID=A0AC60P9U4_IXOPE|nr:hypothetical protein HPB47_006683 [Ixodes persulcatus]
MSFGLDSQWVGRARLRKEWRRTQQREWVRNRRKAAVASTSTASSASDTLDKEHIARLESRRREQNQRCKGHRRANATDDDRATEAKRKREAGDDCTPRRLNTSRVRRQGSGGSSWRTRLASSVPCATDSAARTREEREEHERTSHRLGEVSFGFSPQRGARHLHRHLLRLMDRCRWAKRLFVYTHMTSLQSRWRKRLYQLEKKFGFFTEPVEATTEKEWESVVRKRVREQENVQWLEAARTKSTLTMYTELKQQITAETRLYDNSLGSRLLFEARAGALRTLVYKQRFDNNVQSTVCRVCEGESETSEHIILRCGGIRPSATSPTEEANRLHEGVPPLATALGFSTTSERAGTTEAFWKTIEQTKRRLEDWWRHTQHRGR